MKTIWRKSIFFDRLPMNWNRNYELFYNKQLIDVMTSSLSHKTNEMNFIFLVKIELIKWNEINLSLVTAQEIYRALENNKQKSRRIICFFRDLIDIDDLGSKFRETECEQLLTEVKQLLRQSIDPASIYSYQVTIFEYWFLFCNYFRNSYDGKMKKLEKIIYRNSTMIFIMQFNLKLIITWISMRIDERISCIIKYSNMLFSVIC